jgi:hypothetical protein
MLSSAAVVAQSLIDLGRVLRGIQDSTDYLRGPLIDHSKSEEDFSVQSHWEAERDSDGSVIEPDLACESEHDANGPACMC